MTKRLTISVPDDLHGQLQLIKPTLKVSKICQDALRIAIYKASLHDDKKLKKLVARLREAQVEESKPFYDEGFRDGQEDAYKVGLKGFKHYQNIKEGYTWESPKDWEHEPCDVIEKVDGLGSERSEKKYYALFIAEEESESPVDRKNAMEQFYELVEGDIKKKGFLSQDGKRRELHLEPSPEYYVAYIYYDGWITGLHSVLSVAEQQMRSKK